MIADKSPQIPAIGTPDSEELNAGAFHEKIMTFIEQELPVWRDRPERPNLDDEPHLNEFLCGHLNSASRRQCFDSIQFLAEPVQTAGRRGDIAVKPLGTIRVEGIEHVSNVPVRIRIKNCGAALEWYICIPLLVVNLSKPRNHVVVGFKLLFDAIHSMILARQ